MLLTDRVALITGGAKGMGRGMALRFAEEGCTVAIADISMKEANETIAEVSRKGEKGSPFSAMSPRSIEVKETVEKVLAAFGKIDILVNNAGAVLNQPAIEDMTEEQWDGMIALNLKSQFLFCKFVIPQMKARKYGEDPELLLLRGCSSPGSHSPLSRGQGRRNGPHQGPRFHPCPLRYQCELPSCQGLSAHPSSIFTQPR